MILFSVIRKRGFIDTLNLLYQQNNYEMTEYLFNITINQQGYRNTCYRSKEELLKYQLIAYKLDDHNKKMLYLTAKGLAFLELLMQAEAILNDRKKEI